MNDLERIQADPARALIELLVKLDGPSGRVFAAMNVYVWNFPNVQIRDVVRDAAAVLNRPKDCDPCAEALEAVAKLNDALDERDALIERQQAQIIRLQATLRLLARDMAQRRIGL